MFTRSIVVLGLLLASACQASAGAQVQARSSGEVDANANADSKVTQSRYAPSSSSSGQDGADGYGDAASNPADAMLGARAGLRLVKPASATCQCLGVLVGPPTDPGFTWEGSSPKTNPATQLVIGLSSEGLSCPAATSDSLGASYRGYEIVGNDLVVQVETARLGRPIAQGAVIPKPPEGGRISVRSSDGKSPYGKSADGKSSSCVVWPKP